MKATIGTNSVKLVLNKALLLFSEVYQKHYGKRELYLAQD